jgi:DNA repair photolyase
MARARSNPRNRFDLDHVEYDDGAAPPAEVQVHLDATRGVLSHNDSPDLGFDWSVNPYRGCIHGCAYCYARPSHEYLGWGAGTDFERQLVVKTEAPRLLRAAFDRPGWKGELVVFSGVTDCYQPLEAKYGLTRACLQVCAAYRNPVGVVTKSPLVARDIDVLRDLHEHARVTVNVSIPVFRADRARAVEPYVPSPRRRLKAIEALAGAGLPVCLNVAPFIPGLTEHDLDHLLRAAADAGAREAWTTFLRLPGAVRPVFEATLRQRLPLTADKTLARIRDARGGRLNDPRFHQRMKGEGPYALAMHALFTRLTTKYGLHPRRWESASEVGPADAPSTFRRPRAQLPLF